MLTKRFAIATAFVCAIVFTLANAAVSEATNTAALGASVDDSVITAKIKSALVADRDVKAFDIHVQTRHGEVLLSGSVESQAQVERAVTIAKKIDGVRRIENRMRVER